jgi:hypothetical protein
MPGALNSFATIGKRSTAMPSANRIFLWLLGLLLLGGLSWYAYWFATHFEQQSREIRTDISPEARKNRFLAAEHFLREAGREVQSHAGRDIFSLNPSHGDTIVLGNHSNLFLERNNKQLLEWVSAGGSLILVPEESLLDIDMDVDMDEDGEEVSAELNIEIEEGEEKKGSLFERLGVELLIVYEEEEDDGICEDEPEFCDEETLTDSGDQGAEAPPTDNEITENNVPEGIEEADEEEMITVTFQTSHPGEFQARFLADRYLLDTNDLAEVIIGEPATPNLLRYSLGSGTVTVLSDMTLFGNKEIGKHDHAYLFHQLVRSPGKVWIFYSADMPSLSTLLWKRTPYLLVITLILLLLAGWRMLHNSGPQLRAQYESRRNLLEHLDATAEYSWRVDKAQQLFADNRHAIEQAWHRRHPQLNTMERNECCQWIAERTGISASAVERTLYGDITSEQDFIRATAVMQQLAARVNHVTVSAPSP